MIGTVFSLHVFSLLNDACDIMYLASYPLVTITIEFYMPSIYNMYTSLARNETDNS